MATAELTTKEIVRRGQEIYDRDIRHKVEAEHHGKFLVVDIDSGDYEIDGEVIAAVDRLEERKPDAVTYGVRVGFKYAYHFGGGEGEIQIEWINRGEGNGE